MIPARADKKVCPVFLRLRPGFRTPGRPLFVYYLSDKIGLFVHFFIFFPKKRDLFHFYGNYSHLFPSSTV